MLPLTITCFCWANFYTASIQSVCRNNSRPTRIWTKFKRSSIYEKQLPGKIDLVDVSFSKKDFLRKHRLFLERPVMEDLFWLIHDDYPAANRHLLKYQGTHNPTDYWVIPP